MGIIADRLASMGLTVPPPNPPYPNANRVACVQAGNILYLSGHGTGRHKLALDVRTAGKVGGSVTLEEAYQSARAVGLAMLATLQAHTGNLDRVKRVIRLVGMVNSAPGFNQQFTVVDGASDLFHALWGPEYGAHARAAVGVAELPRDAVLEIMAEFELHA